MFLMYEHPQSFHFCYKHYVFTGNVVVPILVLNGSKYFATSSAMTFLEIFICFGLLPFDDNLYFLTNSC